MHISDRVQTCILMLMAVVVSGYPYVPQPKTTVAETPRPGGPAGLRPEATPPPPENRKVEHHHGHDGHDGAISYEERRRREREEKVRNPVAGVHLQGRPGGQLHRGAVGEGVEADGAPPGDLRRVTPSSAPPPIGDEDGGGGLMPPPPGLRAGRPALHPPPLTPSPSPPRLLRGTPTPSSAPPAPPAPGDPSRPAGAWGGVRGKPRSDGARRGGLAEDPRPPRLLRQRALKVSHAGPPAGPPSAAGRHQPGGGDPPVEELTPASTAAQSAPPPTEPPSTAAAAAAARRPSALRRAQSTAPSDRRRSEVKQHKAVRATPPAAPPAPSRPAAANATAAPGTAKLDLDHVRNIKKNKNKPGSTGKAEPEGGQSGTTAPARTAEVTTTTPYFPYFKDAYCPPECACYGGVVQCSDRAVDRVPYGIPHSARYLLLMNNLIAGLRAGSLREYLSLESLVLSNNRLTDGAVHGAFRGLPALRRLHLDGNLLESVPSDLPASLEELRLDRNRVGAVSAAAWLRCPGLLVLSLRNNSLGDGSEGLPGGALSPLGRLRTLSLDGNGLAGVPLGLPLSVRQLYLRGNRIRLFRGGVFAGPSQLLILDLSGNRLTAEGLVRDSLRNASRLESLNLGGNAIGRVPRHLPPSLKTLNLEGNLIGSVGRGAFRALPHLEHLGLARNRLLRVAPGAFGRLAALHQLDLSHNALRRVPRRLPRALRSATLTHNRIRTVPRDAFCWEGEGDGGDGGDGVGGGGDGGGGGGGGATSGLVRVQLEHNLIDLGAVDVQAFRCLSGSQVVRFY